MTVSDFQFNALADRLRRTELRLSQLERRVPVGDAMAWVPDLTPTAPAHTVDGTYVRLNNLLLCWVEITFTAVGAGSVIGGDTLFFRLPYPVETVVNGHWAARNSGDLMLAWGPILVGVPNADEVSMFEGPSLDQFDLITARGLQRVDLTATLTAGSVVTADYNWGIGDHVTCVAVARVPAGS